MRARLQKTNVLLFPKYEKDLGDIVIYDDDDKPIFTVTKTVAGTYQFSHIGMDDFVKTVADITGITVAPTKLIKTNPTNAQSISP